MLLNIYNFLEQLSFLDSQSLKKTVYVVSSVQVLKPHKHGISSILHYKALVPWSPTNVTKLCLYSLNKRFVNEHILYPPVVKLSQFY